jgi:aspartyl protease family protein
MGDTWVLLKVHGSLGSAEAEALVDTGATYTKIPSSMGAQIGLKREYEVPVEMGDGRIISRGLALAEVEVEGVRRPMLVALGAEGEAALLGYTALELLGFKVNPLTRKLEPANAIEY